MALDGAGETPPAVILTIGDELLVGDRVDSNAAWIARFLSERSVRVRRIVSVGDSLEEIREGLRSALDRAGSGGIVVATGGLGPTRDDRTREAVSGLLGLELVEDPSIVETLGSRFRARGIERLPDTSLRIARVPTGAEVLENKVGSAPGLALDVEGVLLVLLPGVPAEMRHLCVRRVAGLLERRYPGSDREAARVVVHTTGVPESELASRLEQAIPDDADVNLAYRPSVLGVELVFTSEGSGAKERIDRVLDCAAPVLEEYRFETPSGDLSEAVLAALARRGWTVATAESCTGGLVAARLTDHAGSSAVMLGGVVPYSNEAKWDLLGVSADLVARHGAVSGQVARAMATGARDRFRSSIAVGVTGIAGPGGGSDEKPVGTVWFAVHSPDGIRVESSRIPGRRDEVRMRATQHALHLLLRATNPVHESG